MIVTILILAVAFLLRLIFLNSSFWLDEAAQALEIVRPLSQQHLLAQDFQPPLLHYWLHLWQYFSISEWWLRWWGALLPGLITIAATIWLGKAIADRIDSTKNKSKLIGWGAGLYLATHSFHIFYSQELRPYSLPAALAILSWIATYHLLQKQSSKKSWLAWCVCNGLGLSSSYLYPTIVISQATLLLLKSKINKTLITTVKKLVLVCLVWLIPAFLWLPMFIQQLGEGIRFRTELPGWENVVGFDIFRGWFLTFGSFIFGQVNLELNLAYVTVSAIVICLTLFLAIRVILKNKILPWDTLLLVFWLLGPISLASLISIWIPVLQPKRILFILPGLAVFWAVLIGISLSSNKKIVSILASILVLILSIINIHGIASYWIDPSQQRENWRQVHDQITEYYPNGLAVFAFDQPFASWNWYNQTYQYPSLAFGSFNFELASSFEAELTAQLDDYSPILVFRYLQDLSDPDKKTQYILTSNSYQIEKILSWPLIGEVEVWSRPQ